MTKIDIISGFLGAGKTTLIKKLIAEGWKGEKLVLIENEFGEIGIDGGFLKDAGVQINEMNSGCICCSLVGDFGKALRQVLEDYHPDRIIIEPSGVGKLSDVMKAVADMNEDSIVINSASAVVDAQKCKMYMKNFGEFFNNQIENAGTIILSRSQKLSEDKLEAVVGMIKELNGKATVITTPWDDIDGTQIVAAMEKEKSLVDELLEEAKVCPTCGHVHDHDEHHMITTNIIMTTTNIIMTMTNITTTTMNTIMTTNTIMTMTANVAADMIIMKDIIMQMKYLQAGVRKRHTNIQRLTLSLH